MTRSVSSLDTSSSNSIDGANFRRSASSRRPETPEEQLEPDESKFQSGFGSSFNVSQSQANAPNVEGTSSEPTFSSSEGSHVGEVAASHGSVADSLTPMPGSSFAHPQAEEFETPQHDQDPLATPLPRRRAFLMGVINSTARPRQRFQTPHQNVLPRPQFADNAGPMTPLYKSPFPPKSGARRLSHPLMQAHTTDPSTPLIIRAQDLNETNVSPGDASFVSTASSQDLTLQRRANASFDPVMGQEVYSRFDVQKLANYQRGLIKQLQDEAAQLASKVQFLQDENKTLRDSQNDLSNNRTYVRGDLSEVREEQDAEVWLAEKEKLESLVQELESQRDALHEQLEEEQEEKARDKARWKERMAEVEQGVGDIVRELETRVNAAEAKSAELVETERKLREVEQNLLHASAECHEWKTRAERIGVDLATQNDSGSTSSDFLREEKSRLMREVETLTASLDQREERIKLLEGNLEAKQRDFMRAEESNAENARLRDESLRNQLNESEKLLRNAEAKAKASEERAVELQTALADAENSLRRAEERNDSLERDIRKGRDDTKYFQQALETADDKLASNALEITDLRGKLESFGETKSLTSAMKGNLTIDHDLDEELHKANKEIGRLNALLSQSPARKAIEKAKDARIDMLEKQNEDLIHQIARFEEARIETNATTPRRAFNSSGISPMHRHLISVAMRTPRTPGEPLTDVSPEFCFPK